jgi:serine/threonine-protein kinase
MGRRAVRVAACAGLLLVALLTGRAATGDDAAVPVDTARALFDEARQRMAKGDFAGAAADLEESRKLSHGKGILYNLAVCYEHLGRFASAWRLFEQVADEARGVGELDRERVARGRAAALQPKISRIVIEVEAAPPELTVTRDGAAVERSTWGIATPVDPGFTTIAASAPGYATWQTSVRLGAGESGRVHVPPLVPTPIAVAPEPTSAPPPDRVGQPLKPPRLEGLGARRISALAVGGAAVVGLGVGLVYFLDSIPKYSDATARCPERVCSDPGGVQLRNESIRDGNIASVAFAAGISALAGAVILWLTGPPRAGVPAAGAAGNPTTIRVAEW